MQTYEHHGVTITFRETSARFHAVINGKNETAPSLDAIKKKIDKAKKDDFEPMDTLEYHRFWSRTEGDANSKIPAIETARATGVKIDKRRYGSDQVKFALEYTGKSKERNRYSQLFERAYIILDTPEARAAILAYYKLGVKAEREIAKLVAAMEAAQAKIPHLQATDFLKQKGK